MSQVEVRLTILGDRPDQESASAMVVCEQLQLIDGVDEARLARDEKNAQDAGASILLLLAAPVVVAAAPPLARATGNVLEKMADAISDVIRARAGTMSVQARLGEKVVHLSGSGDQVRRTLVELLDDPKGA